MPHSPVSFLPASLRAHAVPGLRGAARNALDAATGLLLLLPGLWAADMVIEVAHLLLRA